MRRRNDKDSLVGEGRSYLLKKVSGFAKMLDRFYGNHYVQFAIGA
jgi:hypothetical protein